jgi:hypothetical protein
MNLAQHLRIPKVFGIGFQKTGTSTLHAALTQLGYVSQKGFFINHPKGIQIPPPLTTAKILPHALALAERYDAFSDNPWPLLYRELDSAFPGSKFILTTRDPRRWIASLVRHFGNRAEDMTQWTYGVSCPFGNQLLCLETYETHNAAVRAYFAPRPRDLLEIDIEKCPDWQPLCDFLGLPSPRRIFPHENPATERQRKQSSPWRMAKNKLRRALTLPSDGR